MLFTKKLKMSLVNSRRTDFQGVIIQPMVQGEFELIMGSKKDPQFVQLSFWGKAAQN
jgi:acyl-CoA synthetase (NDP forming)